MVTCALRLQLTDSILKGAAYITRADSIDPLELNLQIIGLAHVVVYSFVFDTIGNHGMECRVKPGSKVESASIHGKLVSLFADELNNVGGKSSLKLALLKVFLVDYKFIVL